MKADLHIHTTASDGAMSPRAVAKWAAESGNEVMAITDHDSVDGVEEGRQAAEELGLGFVEGIELSTYSVCEIHILGYRFDAHNPEFAQQLDFVKQQRQARNIAIGEKLFEAGVRLDFDFSAEGVGRLNIARQLVALGFCKDISDAFDRFLGVGGRAYVQAKRLTPAAGARLIKSFGGFVSIAHPKKLLAEGRLENLIAGLKPHGLGGLEVYYPGHTQKDVAELERLCARYGLLPTGGSDFHGDEDKRFSFELPFATARALNIR